jgi:Zn-dependent peptidase ImmA (M78 family)
MSDKIIHFYVQSRRGEQKMKDIRTERKKEIEKIVTDLLSAYDFSKEPYVDIVTIVKNDGFLVQSATMPIDITGYLVVNDNLAKSENGFRRLIVVNEEFKNLENEDNVTLKKSRFITAHEYGHFILHKKEEMYAHRDSDKREEPEELEADFFARSILMPMNSFQMVNEIIDKVLKMRKQENNNELKVNMLSLMFKVTKDKVRKRLGDISELNVANV